MADDRITAATFREALLRALGTLSGLQPGVEVYFKDTYAPVLAETGIAEDAYGTSTGRPTTHVWINQAFNKKLVKEGLAEKGSKKGMWTLNSEGVKVARILLNDPLLPAASLTTTTTLKNTSDTLEQSVEHLIEATDSVPTAINGGGVGVSWSMGEVSNQYNPDPYIRSLAMAQTRCFGDHSPRSEVCKGCPLMGACKATALTKMANIATRLQVRDEAETLRRLRGDPSPTEVEEEDLDIDELLETIRNSSVPEKNEDLTEYVTMDIPADTKCSGCGQTINQGDSGLYKRGVGVFHNHCRI